MSEEEYSGFLIGKSLILPDNDLDAKLLDLIHRYLPGSHLSKRMYPRVKCTVLPHDDFIKEFDLSELSDGVWYYGPADLIIDVEAEIPYMMRNPRTVEMFIERIEHVERDFGGRITDLVNVIFAFYGIQFLDAFRLRMGYPPFEPLYIVESHDNSIFVRHYDDLYRVEIAMPDRDDLLRHDTSSLLSRYGIAAYDLVEVFHQWPNYESMYINVSRVERKITVTTNDRHTYDVVTAEIARIVHLNGHEVDIHPFSEGKDL